MATRLLHPTSDERRLRMTYEECRVWSDAGNRGEWVDGEVIEFRPSRMRHLRLVSFLFRLVGSFADLRQLGELFAEPFKFQTRDGQAVRKPDLVFVQAEHRDRSTPHGFVGAVDLAVEVLSEDSVARDTKDEWAEYAAAGVPEYWIVEGREGRHGVEFYELGADGSYTPIPAGADGLLRLKVLPGFWLDPAWLEQEPLPNPMTLLRSLAPDELRALATADG